MRSSSTRTRSAALVGGLGVAAMAFAASASDIIMFENFNEPGDYQGWTVNNQQRVFEGGADGMYMGSGFAEGYGVQFANSKARSITGDLTRHDSPIAVSVDVNVFRFSSLGGNPLDPTMVELILEFVDNSGNDPVSVYRKGITLPPQSDGWVTIEYEVPDPTMTDLPEGWHGSGAYDPDTFEPILPPGRTYTSVLQRVDEVRITTFQPGFHYIPNQWNIGFDNVTFALDSGECIADWNGDGEVDINDFFAYLADFEAGDPRADLNNDGEIDINDFFIFLQEFEAGC